jgi:hypothetical protein
MHMGVQTKRIFTHTCRAWLGYEDPTRPRRQYMPVSKSHLTHTHTHIHTHTHVGPGSVMKTLRAHAGGTCLYFASDRFDQYGPP